MSIAFWALGFAGGHHNFLCCTYSISFGIAFGIISWTIIALFTGKAREIKAATWVIGILFTLTFFLTH